MDDATLARLICRELGRIPGWEYRRTGPKYAVDVVGIFYPSIQAYADRAVGVRVYDGDDPRVDARTRSVQLRFRGGKERLDGADVLANPALVMLTGLVRVDGISGIRRTSFALLGPDDNSREQRTDNYLVTLDNPEATS